MSHDPLDDLLARQRRRAWEKASRGARTTLAPEIAPPPKRRRGPRTRHYARPMYRTPLRYVPAPPQRPPVAGVLRPALNELLIGFRSYRTREQLLEQLLGILGAAPFALGDRA